MVLGRRIIAILLWTIIIIFNAQAKFLGVRTIAFTAPDTGLPMVADVFYPTDSPVPSESEKSVWVRKPFLRETPFEETQKKYPLLIFSHGFQGDRLGNTWIAEELVDAGYMVIALDHPNGNSYESSDEFTYTSLWQRPKDISTILDYVLADPQLEPHIDQNRIAVGGFSLGGMTALWLTGIIADVESYKTEMDRYMRPDVWSKPVLDRIAATDWSLATKSYRDPRVKAVFAIAPDLGGAFDVEGLEKAVIPTLIIVGDKDQVTPAETNARHYAKHLPKAEILVIHEAAHFTFMNKCSVFGKAILPAKLCEGTGLATQRKSHKKAMNKILAFLEKVLG